MWAIDRIKTEEFSQNASLTDRRHIPKLKHLAALQHQKYLDFMQDYIKGESPYLVAPQRPEEFQDDLLLAPRPPTNWERQRQRHTYYTRLQNGGWKSEAMQSSLGQVIVLAQQLFKSPMVVISIITKDQWINQACTASMNQFTTANRDMTLCGHTILRRDRNPMVILDAAQDWRFSGYPQVVDGLVRFYAGIPLISRATKLRKLDSDVNCSEETNKDGSNFGIGTLCIVDSRPRSTFTVQDEQNLRYLGDFVMSIIDYHLCDAHLSEHKNRNQIRADFVTLPPQIDISNSSRFSDIKMLTGNACQIIETCFFEKDQVQCKFHNDTHSLNAFVKYCKENELEIISVPVYESLNQSVGYLAVAGRDIEQVFDQDDENFLITFANSMTTYLQEMLLQRVSKAKTEFLNSMSHEIRTPVHGLTAMTDLLLENEKATPEMINLLKLMQSSGRSLMNVISNVFAFRDLEANSINRGIVTSVNLDMKVQEILDGHASILKPNVELFFENQLPLELTHLNVNMDILNAIFSRLIDNAIKFTDKGTITVVLGGQDDNSGCMQLALLVNDTGRGIGSKFVQEGLFTAFCKEDSFTQGVGLGLALCEKYAKELHHAKVELVTNSIEEGTTFQLSFETTDASNREWYIDDRDDWFKLQREFKPTIYLDDDRYERKLTVFEKTCYKAFFEMTETMTGNSEDCFAVHLMESRNFGKKPVQTTNTIEREAIRLAQRYQDQGGGCVIVIVNHRTMIKYAHLVEKYSNIQLLIAPFGRTSVCSLLYKILDHEHVNRKQKRIREINRINKLRDSQASPVHITPRNASTIFALVVDDNFVNITILSKFMQKRQIKYLTAQSGEEAVTIFSEQRGQINLVFMDIQMEGIDGIEAVRRIRKLEKEDHPDWAPTKIAMLTGLADTESKEASLKSGSNSYHTKPLRLHDIDVILKDWFRSEDQ